MTIDETARILANLYDTCDRCGELTHDLWPTIDWNRVLCRTCYTDLGGDTDGD